MSTTIFALFTTGYRLRFPCFRPVPKFISDRIGLNWVLNWYTFCCIVLAVSYNKAYNAEASGEPVTGQQGAGQQADEIERVCH